jgi:hypothetical protein
MRGGNEKYKTFVEKPKEINYWRGLVVDGRTIFKWILGKCCVKVWKGFIWIRAASSGGLL